jgi:MFS family permease
MKNALRISAASVLSSGALVTALSIYQIYVLGHFDEKWGSRFDNLVLAVEVTLATALVEGLVLFLLLLTPAARREPLGGVAAGAAVIVFAVLTVWWYPPHSRYLIPLVIAIPVIAFVVALALGHWRGTRVIPTTGHGDPAR